MKDQEPQGEMMLHEGQVRSRETGAFGDRGAVR